MTTFVKGLQPEEEEVLMSEMEMLQVYGGVSDTNDNHIYIGICGQTVNKKDCPTNTQNCGSSGSSSGSGSGSSGSSKCTCSGDCCSGVCNCKH